MFKVSPRTFSWFMDLADHVAPDAVRSGDLYDVLSGRNYLQLLTAMNPMVQMADETAIRRARACDLTDTKLGFELLISHQGKMHNALVHLPAADHPVWSSGRPPLVIDAHGFSDSPRTHSARSGLSEAAVESGAISVALGGHRGMLRAPVMNLIRAHDGMKGPAGPLSDVDGPALISFLLEQLPQHLAQFTSRSGLPNVELGRTVAVGFSNGGALSAKLAADGVVDAAISFCGPTSPDILLAKEGGPTNIIFVEGRLDTIVPPGGPSGRLQSDFITPQAAAAFFAARNGSGALNKRNLPPFLRRLQQEGVEVSAAGGRERGLVAVIEIDDNGHAVPGSKPTMSQGLDPTFGLQPSEKLSGAELLSDFLRYVT